MKSIIFTSLAIVALTTFIALSTAAPSTIPNRIEACESLVPPHNGSTPRNTTLVKISYEKEANGTYLVLLSGNQHFQWWRGFFIQARRADNPWVYETFGSFANVSQLSVPFTCLTKNDMIRHSNNQSMNYIYARWTPPAGNVSVRFKATVVQEFGEILENILTDPLVIFQ